jgi:hypothetical protein
MTHASIYSLIITFLHCHTREHTHRNTLRRRDPAILHCYVPVILIFKVAQVSVDCVVVDEFQGTAPAHMKC